ncbi:MAG: Endoribonuclease YbeY [Chlamydiae bacterium]|nr:Endoribonuclease YbeY [Chlamydiota bacterium]
MVKTKKSPTYPRHQTSRLITVTQTQRALSIDDDSAERALSKLLQFYNITTKEIAIHFVSKKTICELHERFFDDPSPTDCITFPSDTPETFLGEVFICPAVAKAYAKKHQLDPLEETTLYLIHGFLHLLGYGDIEAEEKLEMRKEEARALKHLERSKALLASI